MLRWVYYRMTQLVDREIGRVLDALRQAGLEENTLVVFTADHGACAQESEADEIAEENLQ